MNNKTEIRVYYEDTDAGGFVYYANYLKYAERGRTELLRSLGFENKTLMEAQGIAFVVRHIEADYFKPALLDDLLEMKTVISECKKASVVMKQSLFRQDVLVFSVDVTLACIDTNTGKPKRFSDEVKNGFEKCLTT